jgi:hypothetical protein
LPIDYTNGALEEHATVASVGNRKHPNVYSIRSDQGDLAREGIVRIKCVAREKKQVGEILELLRATSFAADGAQEPTTRVEQSDLVRSRVGNDNATVRQAPHRSDIEQGERRMTSLHSDLE